MPPFETHDLQGEVFDSRALKGKKTILNFYPKATTRAAKKEARDFARHQEGFSKLGYEVIGVSSDQPKKVKALVAKQHVGHRMLLDPMHAVRRRFGIERAKSPLGVLKAGSRRSTFVFDENGRLEHALYDVSGTGHARRLRNLIQNGK